MSRRRRPRLQRVLAWALLLPVLAVLGCDAPGDAGGPDASDGPGGAAGAPTAEGAPQAGGGAGAWTPSPEEEAEIVAAVETVFHALETGDGDRLRGIMAPDVVMRWAEIPGGEDVLGRATVDQLVARIEGSPEPLVERMWDPEVRVEGRLATLWAPYDFYVGSELSHCGVDAATLLRGEEGWRVVGLSWTRDQPPACALHPDGPPEG